MVYFIKSNRLWVSTTLCHKKLFSKGNNASLGQNVDFFFLIFFFFTYYNLYPSFTSEQMLDSVGE